MRNIATLIILVAISGVFLVPIPLNSMNNNHSDHEDEDHLGTSYIPCECGKPGCTRNLFTCPWSLGKPKPTPTLYCQPDGEGGSSLSWTNSYGTTSYKIFRSDSQSGTYTLIHTTSSSTYTYTDYPSVTGTYWYKVKAHNNNGDSPYSNAVSCMAGPIPVARQLRGGANRYFPNIVESKLGFTINITCALWALPYFSFKIKETSEDNLARNIKVYIDGVQVWQTSYNIPTNGYYFKSCQVYQLRELGGHVIELEINSGYIENGVPHYLLESITLNKVEFNEAYRDTNNYVCTPIVHYVYGEEKDYAFIAFNTRAFFDNIDLKQAGGLSVSFRPLIVVAIEPDWNIDPDPERPLDYYANTFYIEYIQLKWRVVDPNGYYIDSNDLLAEMIGSWYSADENDNLFGEILWILLSSALFAYIGGWPGYILDVLSNIGLAILDYLPTPPKTSAGRIPSDNAYYVSYENQYDWYMPPMEASMLSHSNFVLQGGSYGDYQVQITWRVKIYNYWVYGTHGYDYVFTLSENYYINCQYVEHM